MRWRWMVDLLPGLAALILWQWGGGLVLDIGAANDQPRLRGFYDRETSSFDGSTFRWSHPQATLTVDAPRFPAVVVLRGKVPADGTRVTLQLTDQASVVLPSTTKPT